MHQFLASRYLQYVEPGTVSNNPIYHLATVNFGIPKSLVIQTSSGANQIFACTRFSVYDTARHERHTSSLQQYLAQGLLPQSLWALMQKQDMRAAFWHT